MAKKGKQKQNLIGTAFNPFRIFFILGLSTFIGMIFMFVIFGSERAGTSPWWQVSILPGMTEGENWLFEKKKLPGWIQLNLEYFALLQDFLYF